jgi:hypothetical protein
MKAIRPPLSDMAIPALAAVALLAALAHWPAIDGGFISDDLRYIADNEALKAIPLAQFWLVFMTATVPDEYLPLRDLSYLIDFNLSGLETRGYHLHNLLLYALDILVLGRAARAVLDLMDWGEENREAVAFLAALLFAVHPAHVEAVAWIAGRKDLLANLFMGLSLWAFARAFAGNEVQRRLYALALLAYGAALLSKSAALPWPLVLGLLLAARLRPALGWRQACLRAMLWTAPFLLLALAMAGLFLVLVTSRQMVPGGVWPGALPFSERLLLILGHHGLIALWPSGLHVTRDIYAPSLLPVALALGAASLGVAAWGAWAALMRGSLAGLGLAIFTLAQIPYLHIVPFYTWSLASDRFLFMASFGLALALAAFMPRLRPAFALGLALVLAAGGLVSIWQRSGDWQSLDALTRANARVAPSHHFAQFLRAYTIIQGDGDWAEARQAAASVAHLEARKTLQAYVEAAGEVRAILADRGNPRQAFLATANFDASVRGLYSLVPPADMALAGLVLRLREMCLIFYEILAHQPAVTGPANYNLALLLDGLGRQNEARLRFRRALSSGKLEPEAAETARNYPGVLR